jgi:hypothetical protein
MSGIIPPSIVNYEWTVRDSDASFLNVSFPFRVKIESIWFTTQQNFGITAGLWQGVEETVNVETTERKLSLAVIKSKNSKTQHNAIDNPTDLVWGFEDVSEYAASINQDLKPTMWLGNPDDAAGRIGAFASSSWVGGNVSTLRSTAVALVDKGTAYNNSWDNETEYNARKYATDVAVMNTDEFLQMFVYTNGGDWDGYENDAIVTISVAYTGIHNADAVSASAKPWTAWWND